MEQQSRIVRIVPLDKSETNRALVQVVLDSDIKEAGPVTTSVDYLDSVLSSIKRTAIRKAYKNALLSSSSAPTVKLFNLLENESFLIDKEVPKRQTKTKSGETTRKESSKKMSDMSREELEAKLAASEAREDAKRANFDSTLKQGLADIRLEMAGLRGEIQVVKTELAPLKGLRGAMITTAIASVIAIVGLVGAIMAYGIASFDSGRETSVLISEAKQQSEANKKLLEEIQATQKQAIQQPSSQSARGKQQ